MVANAGWSEWWSGRRALTRRGFVECEAVGVTGGRLLVWVPLSSETGTTGKGHIFVPNSGPDSGLDLLKCSELARRAVVIILFPQNPPPFFLFIKRIPQPVSNSSLPHYKTKDALPPPLSHFHLLPQIFALCARFVMRWDSRADPATRSKVLHVNLTIVSHAD